MSNSQSSWKVKRYFDNLRPRYNIVQVDGDVETIIAQGIIGLDSALAMANVRELLAQLKELVYAVKNVDTVNGIFGPFGGPVHVKPEVVERAEALIKRIEGEEEEK